MPNSDKRMSFMALGYRVGAIRFVYQAEVFHSYRMLIQKRDEALSARSSPVPSFSRRPLSDSWMNMEAVRETAYRLGGSGYIQPIKTITRLTTSCHVLKTVTTRRVPGLHRHHARNTAKRRHAHYPAVAKQHGRCQYGVACLARPAACKAIDPTRWVR